MAYVASDLVDYGLSSAGRAGALVPRGTTGAGTTGPGGTPAAGALVVAAL